MNTEKTERQTFIGSLRRENRWVTPIMVPVALIFTVAAVMFEGAMTRQIGAVVLALASMGAIWVGIRRWNLGDDAVLRSAENPHFGLLAAIGVGMVLFAAGQATGNVVMAAVVVLVVAQEQRERSRRARAFRGYDAERMSVAA